MTWVSSFTPRLWLILAHDLVVTAAAVLASFFIRFEESGLIERWRLLFVILPPFVVFAALVYAFFDVYKAKWRFTSLPELFNLVRASTVLAVTLLALDYVLLAPNRLSVSPAQLAHLILGGDPVVAAAPLRDSSRADEKSPGRSQSSGLDPRQARPAEPPTSIGGSCFATARDVCIRGLAAVFVAHSSSFAGGFHAFPQISRPSARTTQPLNQPQRTAGLL